MVVHHWILSPARLPVSPLSHGCGVHARQNTQESLALQDGSPFVESPLTAVGGARSRRADDREVRPLRVERAGIHLEALDTAKRAYQAALDRELPPPIRPIVERQHGRIREAHDRVRSLRERAA